MTFSLRRAGRIALVLASVSTLVTLLAAVPAQAMTPGQLLEPTLSCAFNQEVTGGGAKVIGEVSGGDFHTRIEGYLGTSGFWGTTFRNLDSVPHTIGVFTVCINMVAGYQIVHKTVTVAAGGFVRDVALCPVGTVVFDGGATDDFVNYTQPAATDRIVQESQPGTVNGQYLWLTALRNNDTVSHNITFFAVCANAPAGYQIAHNDLTLAAGNFVGANGQCPVGQVVLGGGAGVVHSGSGDFKTVIQESAPNSPIDGSVGQPFWYTALRNHDRVSHTISLYAVCANPLPGYIIRRASA